MTSHITHIQSRSCILFGGKDFLWSLAFHDEEKTCEEHRCVCTSSEPEDAVVVVVVVVFAAAVAAVRASVAPISEYLHQIL